VLTVRFDRLRLRPGDLVLDLGCGAGRHAVEALRRGARTVAVDQSAAALTAARGAEAETVALCGLNPGGPLLAVRGDALRLPFADASFDRIIAAEVLEHIGDDTAAIAELTRVLRPGGVLAITVPRYFPERVCWALSDAYHTTAGGHVRIYRGHLLQAAVAAAGLRACGSHHAHALHTPYWWLRCAISPRAESPGQAGDADRTLTRLYHRFLVWDLMRRPWPTRLVERLLNPVLGKSLVLYFVRCPSLVASRSSFGPPLEARRTCETSGVVPCRLAS